MSDGWEQVRRLADSWVADGRTSAVAVEAGRVSGAVFRHRTGSQRLDGSPLRDDALFVVASITKPVVAMSVLTLVEDGEIVLCDRVSRFVEGFGQNGKQAITVRHLLTHTSGLPDMLPNNRALRQRNAPIEEFVAGTVALAPDFQPGHGVQYQSTGFAVLGEIVRVVTGRTLREFVSDRLTGPLELADTSLGREADADFDRVVELRVPVEQEEADGWGWNSRYWQRLGAPWGGLLSTADDLGTFARAMLARGHGFCRPATVGAATRNALHDFPDVSEAERRTRGWGLGWRRNWSTHTATFGDLLGPDAYGHFGATGTMLWIDPDADAYAVALTNTPFDARVVPLAALSNVVAATLSAERATDA